MTQHLKHCFGLLKLLHHIHREICLSGQPVHIDMYTNIYDHMEYTNVFAWNETNTHLDKMTYIFIYIPFYFNSMFFHLSLDDSK